MSVNKNDVKVKVRNFFSKYFWIGTIIICSSCILNLLVPFQANWLGERWLAFWNYCAEVLIAVLQTVGIAFMLGAIFDFAKNSEGFLEFTSKILQSIMVEKTFLAKLEKSEKEEVLSRILQPTETQVVQYSRIDDYFKQKISEAMKMWDTNFKTNMVLTMEARRDKNGHVVTVGKVTHRMYKVKDRYEDIPLIFERSGSIVSGTRLLYPGGICEIQDGDPHPKRQAGMECMEYVFEVPKELYKYPYLTIEREVFEVGYDHWTNFHWTSLTPYDGLIFTLRCLDGLTIKEHIIFDKKSLYDVTISQDRTEMRIVSTDWLEANTGFSVTISDTPLEREFGVKAEEVCVSGDASEAVEARSEQAYKGPESAVSDQQEGDK